MANSITTFKKYTTLLDEVYANASLTSVLDGAAELAREGANAGELVIPKISMDGLANYSRSSGYVGGDVTLTNETVACNFDRGRMFNVDILDDIETAGVAFGRLSGEFIRTKVVPELDAFRFATYSGITGISSAEGELTTGSTVVSALRAATNEMDEDEVPMEERYLFITPTLRGLIEDLDTTKSKLVLSRFSQIISVPQSRFYTKIDQYDGTTVGETAGGYVKASDGVNINFMVIHKPAVIQYTKHLDTKVILPEANQTANGYKFGYRMVGIADAYENKVAGIYLHKYKAAG